MRSLAAAAAALLLAGCAHPLEIRNLDQYRSLARGEPLERQTVIGAIASAPDEESLRLIKLVGTALGKYSARVVQPYTERDAGKVEVLARISVTPRYEGSGGNWFVNLPGLLVLAPTWNGYAYTVGYEFQVLLTRAWDNAKLDSFTVPVSLDVRHSSGMLLSSGYNPEVTEPTVDKGGEAVADYVARDIVKRLNTDGRLWKLEPPADWVPPQPPPAPVAEVTPVPAPAVALPAPAVPPPRAAAPAPEAKPIPVPVVPLPVPAVPPLPVAAPVPEAKPAPLPVVQLPVPAAPVAKPAPLTPAPAKPTPPAAPVAPPVLTTGGIATLRAGGAVRNRPTTVGDVVALGSGPLRIGTGTHNAIGQWWYVSAGGKAGWALEKDLAPETPAAKTPELKPAPPAPVAAPAAPIQWAAGQQAQLRAGALARARMAIDGDAAKGVGPAAVVTLKTRIVRDGRTWWYVIAPGGSGWALESDLVPAP